MVGSAEQQHNTPGRKAVKENPRWERKGPEPRRGPKLFLLAGRGVFQAGRASASDTPMKKKPAGAKAAKAPKRRRFLA